MRPHASIRPTFLCLCLALCSCLSLALVSSPVFGFGGDIPPSNTSAVHSTFHYELTRTLADLAGFDPLDADLIATVNEAVDATDFTGDGCTVTPVRVEIRGTERAPNDHETRFFHFARRSETCSLFDSQSGSTTVENAPCTNECGYLAEIDEMEAWADGTISSLCSAEGPTIRFDRSSRRFRPVDAGSLEAFAIYLHALADSWSHQKCMEESQWRGHTVEPQDFDSSCDFQWHAPQAADGEEYGCPEDQTGTGCERGVSYTIYAGWKTYEALLARRGGSCSALPAGAVDCDTVFGHVVDFAAEPSPTARRQLALSLLSASTCTL